MTPHYLLWPILLPLISAVVMMFFWSKPKAQRVISVAGHFVVFLSALFVTSKTINGKIITLYVGNWDAPYGIVFVGDVLSGILVTLASLAAFAVSLFSVASIGKGRASFGFFPILQFLLMGLNGSFLAGDLFNLYVWFEVIIISSFVLITLGSEKAQLEGAMKYVTMNLLASIIFLTGVAMLYGLLGSLNLADLSMRISETEDRGLLNTAAVLLLVGFGIKSALFPMYFWLPASYHTPPAAVSAIFGGLLTKVGVYAMFRVFSLLFIEDSFIRNTLIVLAISSMIVGALGAMVQANMRKIFSYLIISHIGFMFAGLGMFSELAIMGAVFYLFHDIIAKTNAFLISGIIFKMKGSFRLENLGGLYNRFPYLSILFALALFSLVGTPPLSGFWPKLYLLQAAFQAQSGWTLFGILLASLLTLLAIVRIWRAAFWQKQEIKPHLVEKAIWLSCLRRDQILMITPVVILTLTSVLLAVYSAELGEICLLIAQQLSEPEHYINAVIPNTP
jgi:multicomponent Na+:H+ antiporter subunit D